MPACRNSGSALRAGAWVAGGRKRRLARSREGASLDAIVFAPQARAADGPATALPWTDDGPCAALPRAFHGRMTVLTRRTGTDRRHLPTARALAQPPCPPSHRGYANRRPGAESLQDDPVRGPAGLARRPPRPGLREGQHPRVAARSHRPAGHRGSDLAVRLCLLPLLDPDPAHRGSAVGHGRGLPQRCRRVSDLVPGLLRPLCPRSRHRGGYGWLRARSDHAAVSRPCAAVDRVEACTGTPGRRRGMLTLRTKAAAGNTTTRDNGVYSAQATKCGERCVSGSMGRYWVLWCLSPRQLAGNPRKTAVFAQAPSPSKTIPSQASCLTSRDGAARFPGGTRRAAQPAAGRQPPASILPATPP
jgi:hypothetical protein